MTPRPKFSKEIAAIAAAVIVDELISGGFLENSQREDCINDVAEHAGLHDDGYEIAKTLDSYAHWDCNFQMAEILDGFAWACSGAIVDAEKEWAAETSPQPPLPVGSRVRINSREVGEITGIYEHGAAKYLVKVDGDKEADSESESRRIVNFESVTAEAQAA